MLRGGVWQLALAKAGGLRYHSPMPNYVTICNACLVGSYLLCVLLFIAGALRWSPSRNSLARSFPGIWEAGGILLFTALLFVLPSFSKQSSGTIEPAAVAAQAAIYLPFVILYAVRTRGEEKAAFDLGRWFAFVFLSFLVVGASAALMEFAGLNRWLVEKTGCPLTQDAVVFARETLRTSPLTAVIMIVLVAPVGEEVIFRGFLYRTLKKSSGRLPAMLAVGLFFGAVHMSLMHLPLLAVLGTLLCVAYEYGKSLLLPIALHMLFNGMNLFFIMQNSD